MPPRVNNREPRTHLPKNFTDIQLQFVAHGIAHGMEPKEICSSAGLTQHMYDKLLARETVDEHQLTVYDAYLTRAESRSALVTIRHETHMELLAEPAYEAIAHAVGDFQSNADLAVRTAKWILQQTAGAPLVEESAGVTAATQVNIYTAEKSAEAVAGFIDSVSKTTTELMATPLPHINDPSKHVHISRAEEVAEIIKGDADPLKEGDG